MLFRLITVISIVVAGVAMLVCRNKLCCGRQDAGGKDNRRFPLLDTLAGLVVGVCVVVLVVSGFINPLLFGEAVSGWLLMTHVLLGAVFAVALCGLIVFRAEECAAQGRPGRFNTGQKLAFWLLAAFGFCLVLTAGLVTLPVLGTCWQHTMVVIHRYAGLGILLAGLMYLCATRCSKQA